MEKLKLEEDLLESPLPIYLIDRTDLNLSPSVLSGLTLSGRRSRRKRAPTEPVTPKSVDTSSDEHKADTPQYSGVNKFLEIFQKAEKDDADAKAIYRKISSNAFFHDNHKLVEEDINFEGVLHLCKTMNLETYHEDETIYEKGEQTNDKVYLVYKGEVEVCPSREAYNHVHPKVSTKSNFSNEVANRMSRPDFIEIQKQRTRSSLILVNLNFDKTTPRESAFRRGSLKLDGRRGANLSANSTPRNLAVTPKINLNPSPYPTIGNEGYFGKEVLEGKTEREDCIVARTDTYLFVLRVKDIEFAKQRYNKETIEKLSAIFKYLFVPKESEHKIKHQLFRNLIEKTLSTGEVLMNERDVGNHFYLLYEGKCEVQKALQSTYIDEKALKVNGNIQKNATICLVESGAIIGEEILFNKDSTYDYTIRVTGLKATFFQFDINVFRRISDAEMMVPIEESYRKKSVKHQEIFSTISKELLKRQVHYLNTTFLPRTPTHFSHHLGTPTHKPQSLSHTAQTFGTALNKLEPIDLSHQPPATATQSKFRAAQNMLRHIVTPNIELSSVKDKEPEQPRKLSIDNEINAIKDRLWPYHHSAIVIKRKLPDPDELSPTSKLKSWNQIFVGERRESVRNEDSERVLEIVQPGRPEERPHFHDSSRMGEHIETSNGRFETLMRETFKSSKDSSFANNIENFKLNFKDKKTTRKPKDTLKVNGKHSNEPSGDSSPSSKGDWKKIKIVFSCQESPKNNNNHNRDSKSPQINTDKMYKLITRGAKVDLSALKKEFYKSTDVSMRNYLATYKKAHLANKFSKLNSTLQTTTESEHMFRIKTKISSPTLRKEGSDSNPGTLRDVGQPRTSPAFFQSSKIVISTKRNLSEPKKSLKSILNPTKKG